MLSLAAIVEGKNIEAFERINELASIVSCLAPVSIQVTSPLFLITKSDTMCPTTADFSEVLWKEYTLT